MTRCQYTSDDEPSCSEKAEWVLREKGRAMLPPWRLRVPFCTKHKQHLLTSPDVRIPWEIQGKVDDFPSDSLYQRQQERGV